MHVIEIQNTSDTSAFVPVRHICEKPLSVPRTMCGTWPRAAVMLDSEVVEDGPPRAGAAPALHDYARWSAKFSLVQGQIENNAEHLSIAIMSQ